jgi:hypothetical protein
MGRRRRHGCDGAHYRGGAEKKQKQPFNVINRTGGSGVVGHFGNRHGNTRRLPHRHHHR